jgi:Flp pilus assembly protein CpaB
MKKKPYRIYLIAVILLIALGVGGYFGYKWWQTRQASPEVQAQQAEEEKAKVLASLSKLMVLPEGDPVLFKVSNEDVMRSQQAFFKDTKNDDVLLVFQTSGKAIIYRPSSNMIVNVGPVNFDNTQPQGTAPKTSTATTTKK